MNTEIKVSNTGIYTHYTTHIKNTKISVTVFQSTCSIKDYVQVVVHNATHKAYRGMGKFFVSVEEAKNHYSNKNILEVLNAII